MVLTTPSVFRADQFTEKTFCGALCLLQSSLPALMQEIQGTFTLHDPVV